MRELFPVDSESTETSLVLRTEDGEEFFLSITDELREVLQGEQQETPEEEPAAPAISLAKPAKPEPVEEAKIRPAEIQNRIRAGASAAEVAEEMGVPESRIEPFAYPVMLERNRIAEIAKQAHPVREDGPAKLLPFLVRALEDVALGLGPTAEAEACVLSSAALTRVLTHIYLRVPGVDFDSMLEPVSGERGAAAAEAVKGRAEALLGKFQAFSTKPNRGATGPAASPGEPSPRSSAANK